MQSGTGSGLGTRWEVPEEHGSDNRVIAVRIVAQWKGMPRGDCARFKEIYLRQVFSTGLRSGPFQEALLEREQNSHDSYSGNDLLPLILRTVINCISVLMTLINLNLISEVTSQHHLIWS